jgi:hypothetical protein
MTMAPSIILPAWAWCRERVSPNFEIFGNIIFAATLNFWAYSSIPRNTATFGVDPAQHRQHCGWTVQLTTSRRSRSYRGPVHPGFRQWHDSTRAEARRASFNTARAGQCRHQPRAKKLQRASTPIIAAGSWSARSTAAASRLIRGAIGAARSTSRASTCLAAVPTVREAAQCDDVGVDRVIQPATPDYAFPAVERYGALWTFGMGIFEGGLSAPREAFRRLRRRVAVDNPPADDVARTDLQDGAASAA